MSPLLPLLLAGARVLWADTAVPFDDGSGVGVGVAASGAGGVVERAAVVAAGHVVIAGADADAAFALAGCPLAMGRAPDVACLARAALLAEATVAVAIIDDDDAVVVSAAGERRRVQAVDGSLADDIVFAVAPADTARLRLLLEPADAHVFLDGAKDVDGDVDGEVDPASALSLAPGEHRLRITRAGHVDAAVVVVAEAGESLRLSVVLAALTAPAPTTTTSPAPPTAPPTTAPLMNERPPLWSLAGIGAGVVVGASAVVVGGVFSGLASASIAAAEASEFQDERQAYADVANQNLAGAGIAYGVGVASLLAAAAGGAWLWSGDP